MRPTLLATLLYLAPLIADAAPGAPATAPQNEEKFYQVDVLVFARDGAADAGNEQYPPPREPAMAESIEPADATESKLATAAARLGASGLRVLVNKTWTQGSEDKAAAKPARLYTANKELDGTVQFYVSRFLHVDVNLQLRDPANPEAAYVIDEHRRIKTVDIHYFDHPKFGVLMQVTPKTPAEIRR